MRITNQMSYQQLTASVLGNQQAVYDAQQQVSSGKRINAPSDDPVGYARLAGMNDSLASVQRYSKTIDQAKSELTTVDSALQQAGNIFQQASEIAVQASDDTKTAAERQAMGVQVDALLNGLLNIANTTYNGHTVFGGTSGAQQAYGATASGSTTDPNGNRLLDTFTYHGTTNPREVAISENSTIAVGFPGSDTSSTQAVFQTSAVDLFATLSQFRNDLNNGVPIVGTNDVQQLQACGEHLTDVLADLGGRTTALDVSSKIQSQRETDLNSDVSSVGSIDIAQAVLSLTSKQQAYQAALSATAGLSKNSLIDWLK